MEKLHSHPSWQQIQEQFFATGAAAPVLAGLSGLIEQMTIEAFDASLAGGQLPAYLGVHSKSLRGCGCLRSQHSQNTAKPPRDFVFLSSRSQIRAKSMLD